VTGHVLDVAWLCPCGQRVPAGETVWPYGEAWRCAACLPAPEVTPWRRKQKPSRRYATGTTLEELLRE
jgi:hypothetical protein